MKKYKSMILLLVVLVVFAGIYLVLKHLPEETEDTPSYVAYILDAASISYTDGKNEMKFEKKDSEWTYPSDMSITLDQSQITSIAESFSQIEATRSFDNPDALADYGLDNPTYTITVTDGNGSKTVITIGSQTGDNYYAKKEGSETVFTIHSTVINKMEYDITQLQQEEEESDTNNDTTTE